MSFPGGSFKIDGIILEGWERTQTTEIGRRMYMAIGIGESRNNATWLNFRYDSSGVTWSSTKQLVHVSIKDAPALCPVGGTGIVRNIPVPNNLFGRVFVEFYGSPDIDGWRIGKPGYCNFEIGDFKLTFSRDAVTIVDSLERKAIKKRYSTREYISTNNSKAGEELNIDCIYASDNEMDYGFGLIMNADGTFMASAPYGNNNEQPEQHLANRVTAYWAQAKRMLSLDLLANADIMDIISMFNIKVIEIIPRNLVIIDGTTFHPIAISHSWRDDVVSLTLLEM
jgi:hypothetical protein